MIVTELARLTLAPLRAIRRTSLRARRASFYRQFIDARDLVFDVGANHGNRVEVFLSLGARTIAVEPQPSCLASLEALKRRAGERLHVVAGVLGSAPGAATIHLAETSELSSLSTEWIDAVKASGRFAGVRWQSALAVEMTTLDALIEEYGEPVFMKIDVEGYELNVLHGLSRRPAALRALSFEFTPERRSIADECIAYCQALGAIAYNFSEGESMALAMESWTSRAGISSVLDRYIGDSRAFGDIYVRFV